MMIDSCICTNVRVIECVFCDEKLDLKMKLYTHKNYTLRRIIWLHFADKMIILYLLYFNIFRGNLRTDATWQKTAAPANVISTS